jgi:hypothetical protein
MCAGASPPAALSGQSNHQDRVFHGIVDDQLLQWARQYSHRGLIQ